MWFTSQREYWKWKVGCDSEDNMSMEEKRKRQQKFEDKLTDDKSRSVLLSAITTLIEDAPEITLLVYIMLCCHEHDTLGQFKVHCSVDIVLLRNK